MGIRQRSWRLGNRWLFQAAVTGTGVLMIFLQGCGMTPVTGLIYTHVTVPYTTDLNRTPFRDAGHGRQSQISVHEPFSGYGLSARTRSNAIGDAAHAQGMETVYFADQEEFSLFGGLYRTVTTHVYGAEKP